MAGRRTEATILLVEDEPSLRRTGLRMLESLGYTVMLAERGHHALERVELGQRISLVVSDFHLPDMDGWELLTRLRAAGYAGGFVLTSGSLENDLPCERPLEPGVPFLGKPYSMAELARVVKEVLDRKRAGP